MHIILFVSEAKGDHEKAVDSDGSDDFVDMDRCHYYPEDQVNLQDIFRPLEDHELDPLRKGKTLHEVERKRKGASEHRCDSYEFWHIFLYPKHHFFVVKIEISVDASDRFQFCCGTYHFPG